MAHIQLVGDKAVVVLVGYANAHHSKWNWSRLLLQIGTGMMLLIFAICRVVSSWFVVPLTLLVTDLIL